MNNKDRVKKFLDSLGVSPGVLEKLALWKSYTYLKRTAETLQEKENMQTGNLVKSAKNWRTTLLAFVISFLNQLYMVGGKLPESQEEWIATTLNAAIAVFGVIAKDGATGSVPGSTR